jgi:hypothetical protein
MIANRADGPTRTPLPCQSQCAGASAVARAQSLCNDCNKAAKAWSAACSRWIAPGNDLSSTAKEVQRGPGSKRHTRDVAEPGDLAEEPTEQPQRQLRRDRVPGERRDRHAQFPAPGWPGAGIPATGLGCLPLRRQGRRFRPAGRLRGRPSGARPGPGAGRLPSLRQLAGPAAGQAFLISQNMMWRDRGGRGRLPWSACSGEDT